MNRINTKYAATFKPSQSTWAVSPNCVFGRIDNKSLINALSLSLNACQSADNWQLPSTIATAIITQPVGWYSFYRPADGEKLSRPKHCTRGAQPVPKAVYRSGCRNKHNRPRCDSNPGPLRPLSHCDLLVHAILIAKSSIGRCRCHQQARPSTSFDGNMIDLPWRNFPSPAFGTKFRRKLPLFLKTTDLHR